MKKLISLGLICALVFLPGTFFSFVKNGVRSLADNISKSNYTVLLCGYDDAAYNTDSIILANFDSELKTVSFLQIPRDTYLDFSSGQNKINGYIPERISSGVSLSDAMKEFTDELSYSLGIKIDGYMGYTMRAVSGAIDQLGGIDVNLPVSVTGTDLNGNTVKLKEGVSHLTGSEAVVFLRYRKGYALGDLSRLDAPKIFISALADKLRDEMSLRRLAKILFGNNDGVVTDLGLFDALGFSVKNLKAVKSVSLNFADMPGEHLMSSDNVSYFCLNKDASSELLVHLPFYKISVFDRDKRFLKKNDNSFAQSYYRVGVDYRILRDDELDKLDFIIN